MQAGEYLIETRGLSRRFGAQVAVDDLNLLVPEAGVYGFLGPNGAGKTTAIRMLLGLIRPDAGEVRLFGQPLMSNHRALMSRVGALVEAPSLYPHLTGRENPPKVMKTLQRSIDCCWTISWMCFIWRCRNVRSKTFSSR